MDAVPSGLCCVVLFIVDWCGEIRDHEEQLRQPVAERLTDRRGGWMAWSLWSACDDVGLQVRSRVCGAQGSAPCVGTALSTGIATRFQVSHTHFHHICHHHRHHQHQHHNRYHFHPRHRS
ncbi:unnamed protein product [Oncorhynchus mykiss]|uniref:Uncharacterized protein n=1 Tax=Oncorhynchus mykiss TaxID=8022 RepID=A0A060Z591_ONCMY|nr:unnamed protein product [Oncorhynchus mykiss]